MKISFVSTRSLAEATRLSLMNAEVRLSQAQKEVVTSRHADVGDALGFLTGQTVSLRAEHARLATLLDTNAIAASRMDTTQSVLATLSEDAQDFVGALIGSRESESVARVVAAEARVRLNTLVNSINTVVDGVHIFGGINSDSAPFADYFETPLPASRQSVVDAFFTAFGVMPSDPAVSAISAADMESFLNGAFNALTEEPAWSTNWSTASDRKITSRIDSGEMIETSVSANSKAIRKLVSAYVMVADLGAEQLNQGTMQVVIDTAIRTAAAAIQELTAERAQLGLAQERVETASRRISIQMDVISKHIVGLEGVDPYEASLRASALLTQIETAYALTARLHQMTLLNHL